MLAAGTAVAVAGLTLHPDPQGTVRAAATPLACLVCGHHGGADVLLNLILFVPLGLGLRLAGWSWLSAVAAAAALSLTVESLQLLAVPGRDASLSDLLSNTVGGGLGAALGPRLPALAMPGTAAAGRLLAGGAAAWVGALAVSAWLLAPGSSGGPLVSNWAHEGPQPFPFPGTVQSAALGEVAMPPYGAPPDTAALRRRLDRGRAELLLRGVTGPPSGMDAWIYLLTAEKRPQLLVTQRGTRATIAVPARALRFRLRQPALALPDALPAEAGAGFDLTGGRYGPRLRLEVSRAAGRRAAELSLSPSHGWVLIAPFGLALGPAARLVTAGCLAAGLLPLGYWGAATGGPRRALALLLAALGAGLGLVPALTGYDPVHWSEWGAAAAAAAAGWSLRRFAAYLEPRCASPSTSVSSSS